MEFQKELTNIKWLSFEKIFKYIVLFIVNVYVVRYLGPEKYGNLSYSLAFVALFSAFAFVGLDQIILREILRHRKHENKILLNSFIIMLFGALLVSLLCIVLILYKSDDNLIILLTSLASINIILQSFKCFNFWFQAEVLSRYIVITSLLTLSVSVILKTMAVYFERPIEYLLYITIIENMIYGVVIIGFFQIKSNSRIFFFKNFDIKYIKYLLHHGWPFMVAIGINFWLIKVDQIMIGDMVGQKALGIYSLAVNINAMFFIIPTIVIGSFAPRIYKIFEKNKHLDNKNIFLFLRIMLLIGVIVLVVFYIFGDRFFTFVYGDSFSASSAYMTPLNLGLIIVLWSSMRSIYIRVKNIKFYNLTNLALGTMINIALNLWLIPIYGAMGAAYSTVISWLMINFIFDMFYDKSRDMSRIQIRTLIFWR